LTNSSVAIKLLLFHINTTIISAQEDIVEFGCFASSV